jgi:prepilin-type N-terminal cleavage/methylation domain-containing protein
MRNKKGFTLLELLLVIFMVVILLFFILAPIFTRVIPGFTENPDKKVNIITQDQEQKFKNKSLRGKE